MNRPYCQFEFKLLVMNVAPGVPPPEMAPLICERCAEVSLFENGQLRKVTNEELEAIKKSPAWNEVILPFKRILQNQKKAADARYN